MFTAWKQTHPIQELLIPAAHFHPYPTASERAAWQDIPAQKKQEVQDAVIPYMGFEWPLLRATDFMAFGRRGDRIAYEHPYFPRRHALAALVLAECLEGQGRHLDDIADGIWLICEESFWGISAHNGSGDQRIPEILPDAQDPHIDLFAAETGGLLAHTLYLLREQLDGVSPMLSRRIAYELERRIKVPFLRYTGFHWMGYDGLPVNNWNPWIIANILSVFLLCEQDDSRRAQAVGKCLECLDFFIAGYHADGGCDEGTSYWNVAGGALFDALEQLDTASGGAIAFWQEPLIGQIGRFILRSYISGRYFINFADGAALVSIDQEMIFRYARRIGDDRLARLAAGFPAPGADPTQGRQSPGALRRQLPAIFGYAQFMQADKALPYERDVWMDGIQVMAARERVDDPSGFYLAAKGGHNAESHNHNDIGSCIVYYDGQPALIDVGVETYTRKTFSDERYTIWTMQSQYHNLPTINGQQQLPGKDCRARAVSYQAQEEAVRFGVDIAGAYPPDAQLSSYERSYILLRGKEAGIDIADRYCFERENNTLTLHWMCAQRPDIGTPGRIALPCAGKTLILAYEPQDCAVHVEECPTGGDARLAPVWGERVYRVVMHYDALPREGSISLRITALAQ